MTVSADPDDLARRAQAMSQLAQALLGAGGSVRQACSAGAGAAGRGDVAQALAELDAVWGTALRSLGMASGLLSEQTRRRAVAFGAADGR